MSDSGWPRGYTGHDDGVSPSQGSLTALPVHSPTVSPSTPTEAPIGTSQCRLLVTATPLKPLTEMTGAEGEAWADELFDAMKAQRAAAAKTAGAH